MRRNRRHVERRDLDRKPRPPVKWAGGKSQLLPHLRLLVPSEFGLYCEPFCGGGALFFDLAPERAVLIDGNSELINLYLVIRDDLEALLDDLTRHANTAEYYYSMRDQDTSGMGVVERASRFVYLNRTGYNGLWRVNARGEFNVPFGRYKKPKIVDRENLARVRDALRRARIVCGDFSKVLEIAEPGAFVYFDPPYHPLTRTASFTGYTRGSFGEEEQKRLARVFRRLADAGCRVMLSNSDTEFVKELYRGFRVDVLRARRAINSRPDRRGPVTELVIRNYP